MKLTQCTICNKTDVPLNESIGIDHKTYCADCFNTSFPDKEELKGKLIEQEADPTICASCGQDFGDTILKKISRYPICDPCSVAINNRAFPGWVKLFLAALLLIVLFSFYWNWRFYAAFNNIKASNLAFQQANYAEAASLMQSASKKIPEVPDVDAFASYFSGIALLKEDKPVEALAEFNKCKDVMPGEANLKNLILQAEMGTGFETKNYTQFLAASRELLQEDTTSAMLLASVASAYACIYADKGVDSVKTLALDYLQKARATGDTSADARNYFMRIEHRIFTREIVEKEEFDKKYPNGWTKN